MAGAAHTPAFASEAEAAGGTYDITVLTSTRPDQCYISGRDRAVRDFVSRRINDLNESGELNGRRLSVTFRNDLRDASKAAANIRDAIADKNTLAMVGMPGWRRVTKVFKEAGDDIGKSKIPFLSDITVNTVFNDYSNVFTMRASQEDERLPIIAQFLKDEGFQRPAFIGAAGEENSRVLGNGLKGHPDVPTLAADIRFNLKDGKIAEDDLSAAIASLRDAEADFIVISLGGRTKAQVLKAAVDAGIRAPVFVFGSINFALRIAKLEQYPANIYQLAWDRLPSLYSDRLRKQILRSAQVNWLYPRLKNDDAPGWSDGSCTERPASNNEDVFSPYNQFAISRATDYADMIGLIASLIKDAPAGAEADSLRQRISEGIVRHYATGTGLYKGAFNNWSFRPDSRTASRTPVIVERLSATDVTRLAPHQYVRLRNSQLQRIKTLYMDIDLVRLHRVNDEEKSFFADFYLSLANAGDLSASSIDFSNAYIDPVRNGPQITITPLHEGGDSSAYPDDSKVYKVSGKFVFRPDFSQFPFDTQLFAIDVQGKGGSKSFVIQPPPNELRDNNADTEDWIVQDKYVGYDEDFISVMDARQETRSVIPFYKASFAWIMKREATDYYLQVIIPLGFILVVAYLSVFIPQGHFEAIVTIQVTALLSAVALYLSIPKVDSDTATVSDRIFLVDYLAVSLMIAFSIIRMSPFLQRHAGLSGTMRWMHIIGFPLLVIALVMYILGQMPEELQLKALIDGLRA